MEKLNGKKGKILWMGKEKLQRKKNMEGKKGGRGGNERNVEEIKGKKYY